VSSAAPAGVLAAAVTCESGVRLDLGHGRTAVAVVTRDSVTSLGLAVGVRACAAFKASSVILAVID